MANGKSGGAKSGKTGKSGKTSSAASKGSAGPKKSSAKSSAKGTAKPVVKKTAAKSTSAKSAKPAPKVSAKASSKTATKAQPAAAAKAAKSTAAKAAKEPKLSKSKLKPGKPVEAQDFVEMDESASELAQDLAKADLESVEGNSDTAPRSVPTSSAELLQAMKPTPPEDKSPEKKKKKDDLKIDRNGDLEAQWQTLKDKNKAIKPLNYKMSESFEARTPVLHKVLGWGFIISNQNDRLEVLFQQGIKFLISNYKA